MVLKKKKIKLTRKKIKKLSKANILLYLMNKKKIRILNIGIYICNIKIT